MPEENNENDIKQESVEITDEMISEFIREIIILEEDSLYTARANIKERIIAIAKTKVR
jgi:hypothetical protein